MTLARPARNSRLLRYAAPAIPLSMLLMPPIMYIPPFYATEMHLSMTVVGVIFFLARLWDAVIDPLVGSLSDQTRSRWGRRKPWIAFGVIPLLISAYLLFQPSKSVSPAYLLIVIFFFYLAWTIVQIPYLSWGAEISADYRERNRVVGFREGGTMIGILLVTGVPALIFYNQVPSVRQILGVFFALTVVLLPLTTLLALWGVPDASSANFEKTSILRAVRTLSTNRPFLRLISGTFIIWLAVYIYNAGIFFVLEKNLQFSSTNFLRVVFLQFLIGTAATPVIVKLADKFGKHTVLAGAAILTALAFTALSQARPGNTTDVVLFFGVLGLTISPIWVLPTALVADAADLGELLGGGKKEGLYMACYNLAMKIAIAASVGIALPLLSYLGFNPNLATTADGAQALRVVALYLPAALLFLGAMVMAGYPVDAKAHAAIRLELDEHRQRLAVSK
ncbi:MFS transporter [Paraburkholderia acidicola]|uniref:MFS transporter n=1 Tax=Paraburkholderia acidicola TaxID=1912599 RepID=A0ABV1LXX9_9BURK